MLWVAKHSTATGTAHHVLLVLAAYADPDGRNAFPSERTLARRSGRARSTVQGALKKLASERRIVARGRRESGTVVWDIRWPGDKARGGPAIGHDLAHIPAREQIPF
jgi:DNA-binding transcriptional MocR family regulator